MCLGCSKTIKKSHHSSQTLLAKFFATFGAHVVALLFGQF